MATPKRKTRSRSKFFWPVMTVLTVVFTLAAGGVAFATDNLLADGVISTTPVSNQNLALGSVCPGGSISPSSANVALAIQHGNNDTNMFANGAAVAVTRGTITDQSPDNGTLSAPASTGTINLDPNWSTLADNTLSDSVSTTVSLTTTAAATAGNYSGTVQFNASGNQSVSGTLNRPHDLAVTWTVLAANNPSCTPSNTAPTINWTANPSSANEGQTKTYNFSITDPDANTWSFATGYPDCGSQGTLGAPATTSINQLLKTGTFQCTFPDGYFGNSSDVKVKVSDGTANSNELSQTVSIANLPPAVAASTWADTTIDCGDSATLTGLSFNDPGNNDNPWALGIDWGDSSTDYSDTNVGTEGAYANQSHTYNAPGTYSATVTVDDKDFTANRDASNPGDNGRGTNTSDVLTVAQTYTVSFLQPLDGSDPSKLIANTMKKGRVVPVKATILDDCTGEAVTNLTGENVTVKVVTAAFQANATDAVESFSDAGSSSGQTTAFRWTADSSVAGGGFWIYNLDSTGFTVGKCYQVKVVVDSTEVNTTYAVLKPTK